MRKVYKTSCPATISASIMAANMWKNGLKNVESDNNKILYENLLDFLQRNGTYFLNKPPIIQMMIIIIIIIIIIINKTTFRESDRSTYPDELYK